MVRRSRVEFSSISSTVWNRRHLVRILTSGTEKVRRGQILKVGRQWNDQTAPDWLWHGSLFVHSSADATKILRQHDASSISRSKSGGTNFYRCLLLRQLHEKLGDNFDESQQALSQRDRRPLTWKFSRFGVVFDGRCALFETLVPLVILRTAQTILSRSLLQPMESLRKSFFFFQIWKRIWRKRVAP